MEEESKIFNNQIPMKVSMESISRNDLTNAPLSNPSESEEMMNHNKNKKDEKLNAAQIANFELRKKVCQKFACLLQKVYSMEKMRSQELTLSIEDKINGLYLNSINEYKQAIKNLLKIIKVIPYKIFLIV